jgi:hypothetical protein
VGRGLGARLKELLAIRLFMLSALYLFYFIMGKGKVDDREGEG